MINFYDYLEEICQKSKLAQEHNFRFCRVSGISGLEECVQNIQRTNAFFAVDDVTDGSVVKKNGHFFNRIILTVFLMKRFDIQRQDDFNAAMSVCRELRHQIFSRILHDSYFQKYKDLTYVDLSQSLFRELEKAAIGGCTGTYIMFNIDIPTNYCYNAEEWNE